MTEDNSRPRQRIWDGHGAWRPLLLAALLAGLAVRVAFLGHKSLWLDEGMSLQVAQAGQAALWQGVSVKDHPPLYFWILDGWLRLGQGEAHLRLLSVIAGVAAIPLAFGLARTLFGTPVGVTAAWLTALSPLLVWYSQEIRNYSQLVFFGLGATYALARLWLDPRSGWVRGAWWAAYIAAMTAALYTHYMAVLLIAVQAILYSGLTASGRIRARSIWLWLTAAAVVVLAYAPWLRSPAASHFVRLLGENALYPLQLLSGALGIDSAQLQPLFGFGLPLLLVVVLGLVYLVFRGHERFWRACRDNRRFQVALVILFAAALAISVLPRGYTVKRQLLVLAPYPLIGLAWFWPWTSRYKLVLVAVLAMSAIAAAAVVVVPKDQWRETVRYVQGRAAPDDVVLLLPGYMTIPFDYYNQDQVARRGTRPADAPDALQALYDAHARFWLIAHTADIADPSQQVQFWLDSHARLIDEQSFYRLKVRLYEK